MENQREDERINELERIIPSQVKGKIKNLDGFVSSSCIGAFLGATITAGITYGLFKGLSIKSPEPITSSQIGLAVGFLSLWGTGIGMVLGYHNHVYNKVRKAGVENPQINDEIWEWAERKKYIKSF